MANVPVDPVTGEKLYSQTKHAAKKRRHRARKKAQQFAQQIEAAKQTILHETKPVSADNAGPEQFAALPDVKESEPAPPPPPAEESTADPNTGSTADPQTDPPTTPPPSTTTPEEAKMFAAAVVWYFQLGTGSLMAKDPRAAQFASGILAGVPTPTGKPLTPEQAFAALCSFVGGCAERTAIKYNLRIPYLDEGVTVGAIGFATWGLVYNPDKAKAKAAAKAAKDANPKPADADGGQRNTNGVAEDAKVEWPETPVPTGSGGINLDATVRGGD